MKSFVLSLLFVGIFSTVMAQESTFGVRAGINVSNVDFDPDAEFVNQHRNGFVFGGFADWGLSENLSLLTELQFSSEGAKADDLRANYIQMPIMLRFALGNNLTLGAGPMVSLKTWAEQDAFSTFTYSAVGGLEYLITDTFFVDARAHYGLSNILDEDLTDMEAKQFTLQFGVGLRM